VKTVEMSPNRPYLIRALYDWIMDNDMTPHILVNAGHEGVQVPDQFIENGKIVLNISGAAVQDLSLGLEYILFSARFSGKPFHIQIPVSAVLAIYARENGNGMVFPEEEATADQARGESSPELKKQKPFLKIVE